MTIQQFIQQHRGHHMTMEIKHKNQAITSTDAKIKNMDMLAAEFTPHWEGAFAYPITGEIQKAYCCGQCVES